MELSYRSCSKFAEDIKWAIKILSVTMPVLHQRYRLIVTGRSHFILETYNFLVDDEEFREIRKLRQTILRQQRSEDTAMIFVFFLLIGSAGLLCIILGSDESLSYWLFNFLESVIGTCVVILKGNIPLDKVIVIIIVALAVGCTPWIMWSTRLFSRNRELFQVMAMLETENEQQMREHDGMLEEIRELKEQSEEKDRQQSNLIAKNSELESLKNKLESTVLKGDNKIESIQKVFKLQKNKLASEFKEEKKKLISYIKELKLKFKNAEGKNLMLEEESLKMKTITLELEKEKDEKLCLICSVNKKHIVLQPCNHLCLCEECHKKWPECPLCRQQIKTTISIFT